MIVIEIARRSAFARGRLKLDDMDSSCARRGPIEVSTALLGNPLNPVQLK
jgi:hypothetical protein